MTDALEIFPHAANALDGHIGYPPGHPDNPYSSLGVWYYVPDIPAELSYSGSKVNRNAPYFGMANVQDFLNDRAKFGQKLHENGSPMFYENQPVQQTLPWSGYISIYDIQNTFGWGLDLNSYRGRTWYYDDGRSGTFPTGQIGLWDFYGKRPDNPVTPGEWDQYTPGYYDVWVPNHNWISVQRQGGGGGGGGAGHSSWGEDTWAFPGGSPAKAGGNAGFLYTNGSTGFWTNNEQVGVGGSWNTPGNTTNIAGQNGGLVGGIGVLYAYNMGKGGDSAWAAGGAGQLSYIGYGRLEGIPGSIGSGGGGGMAQDVNTGLWCFGDGGGGSGHTQDQWNRGAIGAGSVINVYNANGGAGGNAGGRGGNGRIRIAWG